MTNDDAVTERTHHDREPIVPENGMSATDVDAINEENTVGVCSKMEPGEDTIIDEDGERAFRRFRRRLERESMLDDHNISNVFVSCHDGDVQANSLPAVFDLMETDQDGDRIPETCISVEAYELAMETLTADDAPHYIRRPQEFTVMFDDAGLLAFQTDEKAVVCAPIHYPWQYEAARPSSPRGPCP